MARSMPSSAPAAPQFYGVQRSAQPRGVVLLIGLRRRRQVVGRGLGAGLGDAGSAQR